jgi:putative hydrolase of the HAD superfamily
MNLQSIDAIIFDLGGVILNIDYNKTAKAFEACGFEGFSRLYSQGGQSELFDALEQGKISEEAFVEKIIGCSGNKLNHSQVIKAWNAMLLDLPMVRIHLLQNLRNSGIKIFLLSNTNSIHEKAYLEHMDALLGEGAFYKLFNKVYLSHRIQTRKPLPEAFNLILKENGLSTGRILFIDDSIQHIEGAKKVGLKTYFLRSPETIEQVFEQYL